MSAAPSPLVTIVYSSEAAPGFGASDLGELLAASRRRNTAADVTGMLLMEHGRFLQALEGPEAAVRALYSKIEADPRHRAVQVLADEPLAARRFPDWAMANGHVGDLDARPLEQHFATLIAARGTLPQAQQRRESRGSRLRGWLSGR